MGKTSMATSKKNTRRIIKTSDTLLVNFTNGEVVARENSKAYRIPQEPPYVKLYLDTVMYLCDLQERHSGVLMAILQFAPFADAEHQFIILNRGIKMRIAEMIGKTENYVSHTIMELAKGKILIHDNRSPRSSSYQINPHIIARGDWKNIEKLRLHVDFSTEGKSFWSEIQIAKRIKNDQKYSREKRAEFLAQLEAQEVKKELAEETATNS